jgi:hypothetical protein
MQLFVPASQASQVVEPVRTAVGSAPQVGVAVRIANPQTGTPIGQVRFLDYLLNPWRAISLQRDLREQKRMERLSRVQVLRNDLTYQDVEIRLRGKLISSRKVQKLLSEELATENSFFRSLFNKVLRA